jgi:hypothetical protein
LYLLPGSQPRFQPRISTPLRTPCSALRFHLVGAERKRSLGNAHILALSVKWKISYNNMASFATSAILMTPTLLTCTVSIRANPSRLWEADCVRLLSQDGLPYDICTRNNVSTPCGNSTTLMLSRGPSASPSKNTWRVYMTP